MDTELQFTLTKTVRDVDGWDEFLRSRCDGDLLQSSLWARLKNTVDWGALRLIIHKQGCIVGGAQILTRSLPLFAGAVGYVPRGPVLACQESDVVAFSIKALRDVARRHRLQMLIIQPPHGYDALTGALVNAGFQPSVTTVAPVATMRVDLRQDLDAILAQMKSSTRYNVRRSQREGIVVRHGNEEDMQIFSQLHAASSERQGFSTYSEAYFTDMWNIFAPAGAVRLFVSEYEGEAVSALLVAAFGDTVWAKRFGWSGKHSRRMPNEALLWEAISWAKEEGYHYFDQDGVARRAAEALVDGNPVPDSVKQTPTYFKLGFGGKPYLFPEAYAYIYNPFIRFAYQSLFSTVTRKSTRKKVINLLRLG